MTGLEALNVLARNVESLEIDTFYECKGAYQTLEKSLKALEIIKEKNVEMALFNDSKTVEDYNHNRNWGANELTEEEFSLLKAVLE